MPSCIILTGAPASQSLVWDAGDLLDGYIAPIARFAGLTVTSGSDNVLPEIGLTPQVVAWRSLPLERPHLHTGFSQIHDIHKIHAGPDFLSTANTSDPGSSIEGFESSARSDQDRSSQFYEQSFALHEDATPLSSTSYSDPTQISYFQSTYGVGDSFEFSQADSSFNSSIDDTRPPRPPKVSLTPLFAIPSASSLQRRSPLETVTVSIVVGIISNPAPRLIHTRRGDEVHLIETLTGDGSRAGFSVNFWLPLPSQDAVGSSAPIATMAGTPRATRSRFNTRSKTRQARDDHAETLRAALAQLRPRDVVLMRNVALSSFRGKVYGQSLRRGLTTVHLLYRARLSRDDPGGCFSGEDLDAVGRPDAFPGEEKDDLLEQTRRVRDWVVGFVAGGVRRVEGGGVEVAVDDMPPLDTQ